ncbi:DUF7537 family lipoprotein [Salarchaeum japonicum]|uniref:Uncharacterized protein n=1 Tax=Salarchaeum japonicum TaxID=555573 RepID=A0AAV3T3K0_9EURY|nr:hypothetical protein [Salarchaeum japonicum]
MRRLLVTVLLAALVALAGCGGSGTTTTAPTTDETTAATTTQESVSDFPPGASASGLTNASASGLTNASALIEAHIDALNDTAYAFELDATNTGGDTETRTRFAGATDGDDTVFRQNTTGSALELYASGDYALQRQSSGDTTRYQVLQGPIAAQQASSMTTVQQLVLATYLGAGDYAVTGTTTSDGTEYVELRATGVNESSSTAENVESFEATLLVTQDGRIDEFTGTVRANQSGTTTTTEFSYGVTDVGSADPSAPAWAADIPQVTASVADGGNALVVENTGGSAVAANTSLTLMTDAGYADVTFAAELAPGETAYVAATEGDGGLTATVTRDAPADGGFDFASANRVVLTGQAGSVVFQLVVEN